MDSIQHSLLPTTQEVFTQAASLLPPGQLCKVMVCNPVNGLPWELCRRKYDALREPLRYQQLLRFHFTSERWIQQGFSAQDMPVDLCVERLVLHKAPQHLDYTWLEVWTRHENHCLRIYPLPPLPAQKMVQLSTLSRRFLMTLDRPLCLGASLFEHEGLPDSLRAPIERVDPMFDIEQRMHFQGALLNPQDSFRLFLKTREGLLKARLDYHAPLKIPCLETVEPYTLQQRFLKQFSAYWMTQWDSTPYESWYFSCRFENKVAGRLKIQVFALQVDVSKKHLVPWAFTRHTQSLWTASALKGEGTQGWQPEALFQQILMQQPLALDPQTASDYFSVSRVPISAPEVPRYRQENWQAFEEDSRFLCQAFALLVRQLSHGGDAEIERLFAQLLNSPGLAVSTRHLCTQVFEKYTLQIQQVHQHAERFGLIQDFWEPLFQAFFENLRVPGCFLQGRPLGGAYRVHQEKPYILQYFETSNSQGESLLWSLRWDVEMQTGTLLDINRKNATALPSRHPAFTFMQDYQALPLGVKAFIEPYWRYFTPVAHQLNKGTQNLHVHRATT